MSHLSNYTWTTSFRELYDRCVETYRSGNTDYNSYYSEDDIAFLKSIGYKPREFFDFIEDYCDESVPTPDDALLIAAVRRDYLDVIQNGKHSPEFIPNGELPARDDELDGHRWLPRILIKARAKLAGELDPDTMYSCGGDRAFLKNHDIHPADFLRTVWAADGDDQKIVDHLG
ncbi:MAG: hypothetical protein ACI8XO_002364 [Verrucomicrobiales bacterium]|jgi:hypothetical protein